MEAELVALEKVGHEVEWLRIFLVDLPLFTNLVASFVFIVIVRLP